MDYLHGTDFQIKQNENMFHCGSDTELLGCFMSVRKNDSVLDIGTNNGALLLYAAKRKPYKLTGIDLFEEVIEQAEYNAAYNHVDMKLYVSSLQDYDGGPFDLILCNPPYFHTNEKRLKNENPYLCAARHEEYLSMDELFAGVKRLLKSNGRFDMVYRPTDLSRLFICAEKYGLYCSRMKVAYQSMGKNAKTVLLEFCCSPKRETMIEAPVYLNDRSTFGWEENV